MTRLLDLPSGQKPKGLTLAFVAIFSAVVLLGLQLFLLSTLPVAAQSTLDVCLGCTYETIQDAIDAADAEDTIRVAQGVYTENLVIIKGIILEGGYEASGWTRDIELYETTIDGNRSGSVISVTNASTVTIDGFTIRGGYAEKGGGIYLDGASATIRNNSIENNAASPPQMPVEINEPLSAGGTWVSGIADPREAEQVEIWDWTAATHIGTGTVWSNGYFGEGISPPLTAGHSIRAIASYGYDEAVVQAGASAEPAGGDIDEAGGEGELSVEQGDSAWGPGGHRDPGWETREPLHSRQMATLGADIGSTRGGGIYVLDSVVVITGNLVFSNTARDFGGGIYVENSTVRIGGNDVISNSSGTAPPVSWYEGYGGGIAILPGSEFTMTDNLLADNTVLRGGGGVYVTDSVGSMVGNDIVANRTGQECALAFGGGVYVANASPLIQGNDIISNTLGTDEFPAEYCAYGGGVYLVGSSSVVTGNQMRGNAVVVGATFWEHAQGGGIFAAEAREGSIWSCFHTSVRSGDIWPVIVSNRIEGNSVGGAPGLSAKGAGGGLSSWGTSVTVLGNEIVANSAGYDSGGLLAYGYYGDEESTTAVISGNIVMSNVLTSDPWYGGAGGLSLVFVSPTVRSNVIAGNVGRFAGGLYVLGGRALVKANDVVENEAETAGGVFAEGWGEMTFTDNRIVANVGGTAGGIGIGEGSFLLSGNHVMSNTGEQGGGVGAGSFATTITLDANEIIGNLATDKGGGIHIWPDTLFTLTNNIIADNRAAELGGGIYIWDSQGTLVNNTIAENDEGAGEGIYLAGSSGPTITNNIIVTHTYGIYKEGSGTPTVTYNDVWGNSVGDYWGLTPGPGNISADPHFIDPVAWDYHLRPGSPAINAGHPDDSIAPPYDFDGDLRPQRGRVDMGADEVPLEFSIAKRGEPGAVSPGKPLSYTISVTNLTEGTITDVVITDRVPLNASFGWASDGGQLIGDEVVWTGLSIGEGETIEVTWGVTVTESLYVEEIINESYGVRRAEELEAVMGESVHTPLLRYEWWHPLAMKSEFERPK